MIFFLERMQDIGFTHSGNCHVYFQRYTQHFLLPVLAGGTARGPSLACIRESLPYQQACLHNHHSPQSESLTPSPRTLGHPLESLHCQQVCLNTHHSTKLESLTLSPRIVGQPLESLPCQLVCLHTHHSPQSASLTPISKDFRPPLRVPGFKRVEV